jgi:hypothetical protein
MKKLLTGIVFMAAACAAFATGQWAADNRIVYDGESEALFSYTGPEGVGARVYRNGNFAGSLNSGETKRLVIADGIHSFNVRSGVYDAVAKKTVEGAASPNISIDAKKNRTTVSITIAAENGQNRVTELRVIDAVAIRTLPKPQEGTASTPAAASPDGGAKPALASTDVRLLNTNVYAEYFGTKNNRSSQVEIADEYLFSAPDADWEKFGSLSGEECLPDTNLEIALLTYYSQPVINIRPVQADAILPANDPKLSGKKLGAAVLKELAELKFLDPSNTAAIGRYEGMIKFISDKNGVTRAEIESYYRQGIAALITETVDAEFNRISFMLETNMAKSYNVILTRDSKTGQYTLSYERPSVQNDDKKISAPTLGALEAEMRKNRTDFDETGIQSLHSNATLIPAIRLGNQALEDIKVVLGNFYISPNPNTYAAVKEIYVLFANKSTESGNQLFERIYFSYTHTLTSLDNNLLNKVIADAKTTKSFVALSRDQQETFTQTVSARY